MPEGDLHPSDRVRSQTHDVGSADPTFLPADVGFVDLTYHRGPDLSMKGIFPSSRYCFREKRSSRLHLEESLLLPLAGTTSLSVHRFGLDRLDRPIYPFVLVHHRVDGT